MSKLIEIHVPDIGDYSDVPVIEVLVKVGDVIEKEQSVVTLESDKATMDVPSSHAGLVKEIKVKVGDLISEGALVLVVESSDAAAASAPVASTPAPQAAPSIPPVAVSTPAPMPTPVVAVVAAPAAQAMPVAAGNDVSHASPAVRKYARELGVNVTLVKGSGPKGRITQEDVQAFVKGVMSGATPTASTKLGGNMGGLDLLPWPTVDFTKFGAIERQPLSRIKKLSAANLARNWVMIPAVTYHEDADITELEAFRVLTNKENEKSGVKVTMLAFLIKACVSALQKFPQFNSSLDGDALVYKQYWHIGFAADTPNGLMVPVLKDADKKGILQISAEMGELAKKAREGKLSPAEMSGATFTISSLGGIGGRYFTPIINAPEVAILGVCRSTMEPVWNGKEFVPRLMLPLSLTWDHRVIDGAAAARFNAHLGQILSDFRRVLL